jgi:hypothetical protein
VKARKRDKGVNRGRERIVWREVWRWGEREIERETRLSRVFQ